MDRLSPYARQVRQRLAQRPLCLPCRFESRTRQVPEQGAYSPRAEKTHGADETGKGKRGTFQGVERQVLRSGVHGRDDSRPCAGQRGSLLRRGQCVASLRRTVRVLPQAEYAGILRTDRKQEGRDRRVEPRNIQGAAVERAV